MRTVNINSTLDFSTPAAVRYIQKTNACELNKRHETLFVIN